MTQKFIQPVILSGGSGTRLWPLSREKYPKQVLPLASNATMIQETAKRVHDPKRFEAPLIICNDSHRFIIAEQMRELDIKPKNIILEPVGRNTAPAVAVAALMVSENPDAILFVMPSDHVIQDFHTLLPALEKMDDAVVQEGIISFGLPATSPETGYGYIQRGSLILSDPNFYEIKKFIEKPKETIAQELIEKGDCFWNSGMFLFKANRYLEELERYCPDVIEAARKAIADGETDMNFFRLDKKAFEASPSISIDHAVMEHTDKAIVAETDLTWSDVGSWSALFDIGDKDPFDNVVHGDVELIDVSNSYIRSEAGLVAAIGLQDIIIVATEDVTLLAPKDRAQEVKRHVENLRAQGRTEIIEHKTVYRPWGHYRTMQTGDRFQVKQITVKPGAKLSLQKHHHRAEHWVVVSGTALVTRDEEILLLTENESTYIPLGAVHRLENPGKVPLDLIEIQSGTYLGEDDIVRFEDQYGREGKTQTPEISPDADLKIPAE